jgi:hypothetical protein
MLLNGWLFQAVTIQYLNSFADAENQGTFSLVPTVSPEILA